MVVELVVKNHFISCHKAVCPWCEPHYLLRGYLRYRPMQITGSIVGWVNSFYETPTYAGEAVDYRLRIRVEDASEIIDELSKEYDRACDWYRSETGKKSFFDAPFEMNADGSADIKMCAKLTYGEFPFPAVDSELQPLAEDLVLCEGSKVIVKVEPMFHPRKSTRGGLRLCPKAVQVVEAVTRTGRDSGPVDVAAVFSKQAGFKQSKPNLKELATITSEDPDF